MKERITYTFQNDVALRGAYHEASRRGVTVQQVISDILFRHYIQNDAPHQDTTPSLEFDATPVLDSPAPWGL